MAKNAKKHGKVTTKKELVKRIAKMTDTKQFKVKEIVQSFLNEIIEELAHGNRLEFREFGVFYSQTRNPRMARNPRTNAPVPVGPKTVVHFKVGRLMKEKVKSLNLNPQQ